MNNHHYVAIMAGGIGSRFGHKAVFRIPSSF